MFQHVSQPRAFVLPHAPEESAGLLVGTAVFGKAGQGGRQRVDEPAAEPARGPRLEVPQVELDANDGKMRVQGRSDINRSIDNAHGATYSLT